MNTEERITTLEVWQQVHDTNIKEFKQNQTIILSSLSDLNNKVSILIENNKKSEAIPSLEPRIRALEDEKNKLFGGYKMLILLGSILGTLTGWIVSFVSKKL